MKNVLMTIILLFITITIGYAGIFKEWPDEFSGNYGANYDSNSSYSEEITNDYYGGFFRSSTADNPGGRPDSGDGIGQEAPIGNGLPVIVVCCLFLVVVKFHREIKKRD